MADLTIGTVKIKGNVKISTVLLGETVSVGQPVRFDSGDGDYLKTNPTTLDGSKAAGITLTSGVSGDYAVIIGAGDMDLGATLVKGRVYVVSDTAGNIGVLGDNATGKYITILGRAKSANTLEVKIDITEITAP